MFGAAQKGDEELIKTCIANGADTRSPSRQRSRPVREAAPVLFANVLFSVYIFPRPKSPGGDWLRGEELYMCATTRAHMYDMGKVTAPLRAFLSLFVSFSALGEYTCGQIRLRHTYFMNSSLNLSACIASFSSCGFVALLHLPIFLLRRVSLSAYSLPEKRPSTWPPMTLAARSSSTMLRSLLLSLKIQPRSLPLLLRTALLSRPLWSDCLRRR